MPKITATVTDVVNEMIREVTEEVRVLLAEKEQLTIEGILIGLNEIMQKNTILYQQIAKSQRDNGWER